MRSAAEKTKEVMRTHLGLNGGDTWGVVRFLPAVVFDRCEDPSPVRLAITADGVSWREEDKDDRRKIAEIKSAQIKFRPRVLHR